MLLLVIVGGGALACVAHNCVVVLGLATTTPSWTMMTENDDRYFLLCPVN
jgi:hypothetical protein